ncbi:MAG: hypothetical protein ABJB85_06555, partial [Nitrososphaerota archaeon]
AVTSLVKVDGTLLAKLDEVTNKGPGPLDSVTKVNSMDNVTEVYSKGFNITIPEDTHMADQNTGDLELNFLYRDKVMYECEYYARRCILTPYLEKHIDIFISKMAEADTDSSSESLVTPYEA